MANILSLHGSQFETADALLHAIQTATDAGQTVLLLRDHKMVGAVVSPDQAKETFCRMVVERLAQNPQALSELHDRLQNEEPKDWE